jgi:hypothetical protein
MALMLCHAYGDSLRIDSKRVIIAVEMTPNINLPLATLGGFAIGIATEHLKGVLDGFRYIATMRSYGSVSSAHSPVHHEPGDGETKCRYCHNFPKWL